MVQFCETFLLVLGGATGGGCWGGLGAAIWCLGIAKGSMSISELVTTGFGGSIMGGWGRDNFVKSNPYSSKRSSDEFDCFVGIGGSVKEVLCRGRCREVGGSWGGFSSNGSKMMSSGVSVPPKAIRSSSGESPCNYKQYWFWVLTYF